MMQNLNNNRLSANNHFTPRSALVPMVIKKTFEGERSMDIFSRLLDERIVMLTGEFEDQMAALIISQLLYLQSEDSSKDITMYINSGGGAITAMWSIIDTMNLIKPDVSTVCIGMAASAASLTLANGAKGKRFILPNAEVMIHQPLGGASGQASDVEIRAKRLVKIKKEGTQFMAEKTGQEFDKVYEDMDRDYFMSAKEAVDYGIVDKIIGG
jgi:ATP-dependent Clp protease protease subunit